MTEKVWLELEGSILTTQMKKALKGYYRDQKSLAKPLHPVGEWLNLGTGARVVLVGPDRDKNLTGSSFRVFHLVPGAELLEISQSLHLMTLDVFRGNDIKGRALETVRSYLGFEKR